MKLGISYMVFDGEELLPHVIRAIKSEVDFISVVYQTTSYFNNPVHEGLLENLKKIKEIDCFHYYEPDLAAGSLENQFRIRVLGLQISKEAGCTHHIAADVDEFYILDQLIHVKNVMDVMKYDHSIVRLENYFKKPTYLIRPNQNHFVSFIHPVTTPYTQEKNFPFRIDIARRHPLSQNYKLFNIDEFVIHHMSYVRKDIRRKLMNSSNGCIINIGQFVEKFNQYQLGERVKIPPDLLNRKTISVKDLFNIGEF